MRQLEDQGAQLEKAVAAATANRDRVNGEAEEAQKKSADVQQQVAELTYQLGQKNTDLVGVDIQLQNANAELAKLRARITAHRHLLAKLRPRRFDSPLAARSRGPQD